MKKQDTIDSLELSLIPAVLASSCCLTIPALALLGISFGENIFYEYRALLRFIAFVILFLSLAYYFLKKGIRTKNDFLANKKNIYLISAQTVFFAVFIYVLFLVLFVPFLCNLTELTTCTL